MRLRTTSALLISGLLCAPAPLAQQGGQQSPPPPKTFKVQAPSGTLTESAWGDFDGDGQNDVAFLASNELHILFAPGLYESLRHELGFHTHLAAVRRPAAVDLLVVTTFTGGKVLEWTGSGFTSQDLTSEWSGVDALDAHRDAAGTVWIAGVDGTDLLVSDSSDYQTTTVFSVQSSEDLRDVVVLEWEDAADTPDRPEVAVMSDSAVALYDAATGALDDLFYSTIFVNETIERLHHDQEQLEHLAVVTTGVANPTYQWFSTLDSQAGVSNGQLAGVNKEYYAIATGDTNGDGLEDLVLSGRSNWGLTWVTNVGTTGVPVFDFGDAVTRIPDGTSPGGESAKQGYPSILDMDRDGDGDVFLGVQQGPFLWVVREQKIEEDTLQPLLNPSFGEEPASFYLENQSTLHIELLEPEVGLPGDFLDVFAWGMSGADQPLDATAFWWQRIDASTITWPLRVEMQNVPYAAVNTPPLLDGLVFFLVQSVDTVNGSASDPISACYPGKVYGLHGQGSPSANESYLLDMMHAEDLLLTLAEGNPGTPVSGKTYLGGSNPGGGGDINCLPPGPTSPPTRP